MQGVGFISQVIQGGTLGEPEGTKGQQMECYVPAEDAGVEGYMQDEGGLG